MKAQKLSSRKAEVTMRIAEVYVQLGQNERAIKDLKSLIREYPHLIPARLKLGGDILQFKQHCRGHRTVGEYFDSRPHNIPKLCAI